MNDELLPPQSERSPLPAGTAPDWAQANAAASSEDLRAQSEKVDKLGMELYDLYPDLCAWGKRKHLSHHDAEEAAMEAIRRVLTAVDNGAAPIFLRLYAFKALFTVIGEYKSPKKKGNHTPLDVVPEPVAATPVAVDLPDDSEAHPFLSKVLTERQKSVFVMRIAKEMTYREIAEELGISPSTVGVHLFKARLRVAIYKGQRPEDLLG
ncbi:sigma-70 family RNA polymerase sigma factor [Streptomyces sp. NBC_01549]|uniref:sigma-70 family RNA polymerase sigma factor n=1 Tax=Streptomyces sp. NBC_01549 TaxID=2975874 RepID=UPI00224D27D1|nr:sigma-70 family RNA polymerase sigma factor [Streptomyces sp. NBC_01549]MCX4598836.1 sigma-70 family RNA polymerase sigma factor [Streptomyces sp. NBC_01549]